MIRIENEKVWYAFSGKEYSGNMPAFFPPEEISGLQKFESALPEVLAETSALLNNETRLLQSYFNKQLVNGDWKVLHLVNWGEPNDAVLSKFPLIDALLKNIPGLTSAAISRLHPNSEIHPHMGDTNAIVRCHYGLQIPALLPDCGIEVKGEQHSWEAGKWLVFCDAHHHAAWNKTSSVRDILIIDVLLPQFEKDRKEVCANVRSMLQLQATLQRNPWMNYLPGKVRGLIRRYYKRKL